MKIQNYKELNIWKKGMEIVLRTYQITKTLPKCEQYGLTTQMQRAAVSIPSNIAEGFMRNHTREYIQFLYVALASCAELETQMIISQELGYILLQDLDYFSKNLQFESCLTMNLIKVLERKIKD